MIRHTLSLEIPDVKNPMILRLVDTSQYGEGLPVDCGTLQITLPGHMTAVVLDVTPGFIGNITGSDLGLGNTALPDGVYTIRYSVSPNDKVWVEYDHLRTTGVLTRYYEQLCRLALENCEAPADVKQRGLDLQHIKLYLDAAKAKVEYCHQVHHGMELVAYAEKLLKRYSTTYCLNC
jgi:hypothetical protein